MFWKIENKLSAMGYKAGLLEVYGMALLIDFKQGESLGLCQIIFAISVKYCVAILENSEFLKIAPSSFETMVINVDYFIS